MRTRSCCHGLQADRAVVLDAAPVLRKQARPMHRVGRDDKRRALVEASDTHGVAGRATLEERAGLVREPGVGGVEEQAEAIRPTGADDAAVSEVQPQQFGVLAGREPHPSGAAPATWATQTTLTVCSHVPNGCPREPRLAADRTVRPVAGSQLDHASQKNRRVHEWEHMFVIGRVGSGRVFGPSFATVMRPRAAIV